MEHAVGTEQAQTGHDAAQKLGHDSGQGDSHDSHVKYRGEGRGEHHIKQSAGHHTDHGIALFVIVAQVSHHDRGKDHEGHTQK